MKTIQEVLCFGKLQLEIGGCDSPYLDAIVLLCHVLKVDQLFLHTWPKQEISNEIVEQFSYLIKRRQKSEPVAYIVGVKEFFARDFIVNQDVLIPRPDTEKLIEMALTFLPIDKPTTIIDVCTGSGCIGITLALERPKAKVMLTDISGKALKIAEKNIGLHGVSDSVYTQKGDLLNSCQDLKEVDLIVANPPYIKASSRQSLARDVYNFEPHLALFGEGEDGLMLHRQIIETGLLMLKKGGHLILEIGSDQKEEMENWATDKKLIYHFIKDDADHDRLICIENFGAF